MTDAEIRQAENAARAHLSRVRTLEARLVGGPQRRPGHTDSGIVPGLCETILKLTAELQATRGARR